MTAPEIDVALDHVIVICDQGAPQGDALSQLGIVEGSANAHVGQGTANRRFFFQNAYIELLWVDDLKESQKEPSRRTRLWERWLRRHEGACPFGVALRPAGRPEGTKPPFPTWAYHAPYLPEQVSIGIALATPLIEPEFLYLNFATPPQAKGQEPLVHPLGVAQLTSVRFGIPGGSLNAPAAKAMEAAGLIEVYESPAYAMELTFDRGARNQRADLEPALPLILRW